MVDKGVGLVFTLRKHWKKSIFAGCLMTYGFHFGSNKFREFLIRRKYFFEAEVFGKESCSPIEKPRRLYVLLNPVAGNSNAKKLFLKNAAPIFYLAGIDLTYIQTDYEGHSKTIVNYVDPIIDGIVVAGGDGTLQEVVTGIFRQPEYDAVLKKPVGFIPLGNQSNFIYRKLFGTPSNQVRSICDAAMSVVKGHTKSVAVMDIKTSDKSIYALSAIHAGENNDIKKQIEDGRFWIFGPLKRYLTVVWKTIRNWDSCDPLYVSSPSVNHVQNIAADMPSRIPTLPLTQVACQHTEENDKLQNNNNNNDDNNDKLNITNNSSGQYSFTTKAMSLYLHDRAKGPYFVLQNLKIDQSRPDFINYGFAWMKNNFEYTPTELSDTVTCTEVTLTPSEDSQNLFYGIDGETFDARPITVSICPKRLTMFCKPS